MLICVIIWAHFHSLVSRVNPYTKFSCRPYVQIFWLGDVARFFVHIVLPTYAICNESGKTRQDLKNSTWKKDKFVKDAQDISVFQKNMISLWFQNIFMLIKPIELWDILNAQKHFWTCQTFLKTSPTVTKIQCQTKIILEEHAFYML